ncbi:MAG: hypothetical protein RI893_539 [Pseudomonadota bacterium]|jgi:hypothetical protein
MLVSKFLQAFSIVVQVKISCLQMYIDLKSLDNPQP